MVSLKDWPRCHFGAFHPDERQSLGPAAANPRCSNPAGTWPVWGFPFPQLRRPSHPDLRPHNSTPLRVGLPSNIQKDISGVLFLYSHFLRINGLIDADSLKNKREGKERGG